MSEGIPYADLVILALIAGFILLRLRSVLGDKMGNDNPQFFNKPAASLVERQEPIVQLDDKSLKQKPREELDAYSSTLPSGVLADVITGIKAKDLQFTATHFLEGAKAAFEMVFDAFAKGDTQTLSHLLSDKVFMDFCSEIAANQSGEHRTEHTLVSAQAKDITQAMLTGNIARLTVHFQSEQVTVVRNSKGDIVEGNPSDIHAVDDYWTFERDVTSKSPNWKVIET